jgi:hypothetical protein
MACGLKWKPRRRKVSWLAADALKRGAACFTIKSSVCEQDLQSPWLDCEQASEVFERGAKSAIPFIGHNKISN